MCRTGTKPLRLLLYLHVHQEVMGVKKQQLKCQQYTFSLSRHKAQGSSVLRPSSAVREAQKEVFPPQTVTVTPGLPALPFFPRAT